MSPSNNNSGMELPPPVEAMPTPASQPETAVQANERPQLGSERPPQPLVPINTALPGAHIPGVAQINDDNDTTDTSNLQMKKESDRIHKQWIQKIKTAVNNNRDDPYKQSEAITLIRAEFMKQEFNKTLKITNK